MKLYFHYCSPGFSNCYILGEEKQPPPAAGAAAPLEALVIDPGNMNTHIVKTIENNNLSLRAVLITHDHLNHVHGLRTLKRIYNAEVFAINRAILDHKTTPVKDGEKISIGPFKVEVISIPGHSADSAVFRIDTLLFTGDVLTAGLTGQTVSAYGAATQMGKLRSRLLALPGDYTVLPGHGPPSSLEAERRFNAGIIQYNENRNRKSVLRLNI